MCYAKRRVFLVCAARGAAHHTAKHDIPSSTPDSVKQERQTHIGTIPEARGFYVILLEKIRLRRSRQSWRSIVVQRNLVLFVRQAWELHLFLHEEPQSRSLIVSQVVFRQERLHDYLSCERSALELLHLCFQ